MTLGEYEYTVRQALNAFDTWNDVTGVFDINTGYYHEIQGVIEDAVKIGIYGALGLPILFDEDGLVPQEMK